MSVTDAAESIILSIYSARRMAQDCDRTGGSPGKFQGDTDADP